MILTTGSIYGLTPDPRWTCGIFTYVDDEGATVRYELPFLGWVTQVTWSAKRSDDRSDNATSETNIVPVFLDEESRTVTLRDLRSDRTNTAYVGLTAHRIGGECNAVCSVD